MRNLDDYANQYIHGDFLEGMYQMEKYLPQYGSEIFVHLTLQKDGTI